MNAFGECIRCGRPLPVDGICSDLTCGFNEHTQSCMAGWNSHPDKPTSPCTCEDGDVTFPPPGPDTEQTGVPFVAVEPMPATEALVVGDELPPRRRMYDILKKHDLWQRVFHPFPDNDEAGQVQLIDMMPRIVPDGLTADFAIPQMARVSYGSGTKKVHEDRGLIRYLKRNDHDSPFEAITFKFRIRCPVYVYRQWFRHRTTDQCEIEIISTDENARKFMSMNEYSARYSVVPDIFYIPQDLRAQSKTNKQGGEELLKQFGVDNGMMVEAMAGTAKVDYQIYAQLLKDGVSRELARSIIPVCYVTEFYMVANLLNLFRWLQLRLDPHAQLEIRVFAQYIASIIKQTCPVAYSAFEDYMLMSTRFSFPEMLCLMSRLGNPMAEEMADAAWQALSQREKDEFEAKLKGPVDRKVPEFGALKSSIPPGTMDAIP